MAKRSEQQGPAGGLTGGGELWGQSVPGGPGPQAKPRIPEPADRIRRLLLMVGDTGMCKSCYAQVVWVAHKNGNVAPYDLADETIGVNHFVTCPCADKHKRKR